MTGFDKSALPEGFLLRMNEFLSTEYDAFLSSYDKPQRGALRVNRLKVTPDRLPELTGDGRSVPWSIDGYYYGEDERPGKSPLHEAGSYYIQEASAMLVAAVSGASPGERILDLCAAPGGKSTALAAMLCGSGLLVSNEIMPARVKVLSQNIERMGIANAIVTSEPPAVLAERFPEFFDRVIVDAPCSGEGMFRKEPDAISCWSPDNIALCAGRQQEILDTAVRMLRPGGTLVYSTCTFAPEEDEKQVKDLLARHRELKIARRGDIAAALEGAADLSAVSGPLASYNDSFGPDPAVFRIWPHLADGEGHFAAVIRKSGVRPASGEDSYPFLRKAPKVPAPMLAAWKAFAEDNLSAIPQGTFTAFGDNLYLSPAAIDLSGLRCLRPGLQLGALQKDRFVPSHALALAMRPSGIRRRIELSEDDASAYIAGTELVCTPDLKGWCLASVRGISLGWAKASGGRLKNHYPKGLRR